MNQSIHNQVVEKILKKRKGNLIFPSDFDPKNYDSARQTLSKLARQGVLERMAQGIYLYPKRDPELGIIYPTTEEIAQAIAKRDKARIIPTGLYAQHRLGLSTQVPMKVVYLTDGSPRKIRIGKRTITFKPTSPKKLAVKGKLSSLVIQALQSLGKDNINQSVLSRAKNLLLIEERNIVEHDAKLAPEWIGKIMRSLIPETHNE